MDLLIITAIVALSVGSWIAVEFIGGITDKKDEEPKATKVLKLPKGKPRKTKKSK